MFLHLATASSDLSSELILPQEQIPTVTYSSHAQSVTGLATGLLSGGGCVEIRSQKEDAGRGRLYREERGTFAQ